MSLVEAFRTAAEMYEPDDTVGLLGLLIIGLPATLAAIGTIVIGVLTVRGQRAGRARARKIDAKTEAIHEQTVNTHDTNMRDDLDEIRDMVKVISARQIDQGRDIRGLRTDVGELRGEDHDARAAHDDLVRRLNAFIRREHPGADPLRPTRSLKCTVLCTLPR